MFYGCPIRDAGSLVDYPSDQWPSPNRPWNMTNPQYSRFLALAVLVGVAACERPTGPELLAKMDQAQTDIISDTTGERLLSWRFNGSWQLIRLLPNGQVDQNLVANIDGEDHRFNAFVFERGVVRLDPHDGYPCPLGERSLLAIEGGQQALFVQGSDFSKDVSEHQWCASNPYTQPHNGTSPFLWIERLSEKGVEGISGTARIDDAGRTGDCSFLKAANDFPLRVDCELRDYTVQLAVRLGLSRQDTAPVRGSRPRALRVSYQRLPGLRLVIHCSEKNTGIGGCEAPYPGWRNE